ncbi:MAG: hypothetical protein ACR2L1_04700 [Pyrinomonadaceae bacterium]
MNWLLQIWESLTWGKIGLGLGLFVISLTFSTLAVGIVMVKIPADYFSSHHHPEFMSGKPFLVRWSAVILKNFFGVILIVLGILLSLPGVPGQGLLTILLGLIMMDIPGKKPIEAKIIKRPAILSVINKLRARHQKPPLILD